MPRIVDDEDLADHQVSSLNLLKAQRARKLEAANTALTKHTASVQKDKGKGPGHQTSTQRSPAPEATGHPQSQRSEQPQSSEDHRDPVDDELDRLEEELQRDSVCDFAPESQHPGPGPSSHRGASASTLSRSSILTNQFHHVP